jgi:hypothetical protein
MMLGKALTTAEAIEGITDAGKFEILATRVLCIVSKMKIVASSSTSG